MPGDGCSAQVGDEEKKKQLDCLVSFYRIPSMRPLVSLRGVQAAGARSRHDQNVISAPHLTTDSAACHAIPKDFGVEDGKHLTALHSSCIHTACLALKPDLHARRPVTM